MLDERPDAIKVDFPLRKIRLDMCECGHDDSDHQTERTITGAEDGCCSLCVCKKFAIPERKE